MAYFLHWIGREEKMGKKKLIVSAVIMLILSTIAIFNNAAQDKRRKFPNTKHRDIYLKNKFRPRIVKYNQRPYHVTFIDYQPPHRISLRDYQKPDFFSSSDRRPRYAPGELIVKFKRQLTEFEVAYLLSEFQFELTGAERMLNGSYVLRFKKNCSLEHIAHNLERNPYVEYVEPNFIYYIPESPGDFKNDFPKNPHEVQDWGQILEAPKKEEKLYKGARRETKQGNSTSIEDRKAVERDSGIPASTENEDRINEIQLSDPKRIIRSKAKIYSYRDSRGRLVFTNYCCSKIKPQKK